MAVPSVRWKVDGEGEGVGDVDIQAVILAGGQGTRLRPVTANLPKPLVPVANRPLIEHQLRHLAERGVLDVTLALGYGAEKFKVLDTLASELGMTLRIVVEPAPLGTGGALRYCADEGAFDDRPLLWMNGDIVAAPDVATLAEFHIEHGAMLTFWLTSVRDRTQFGVLEIAADGFVESFLEKPSPDETASHLVNSGIVMVDPAVLRRIPPDTFFSFERSLVPAMVREREPVYGQFRGGYWLDTGRPHLYLEANRHVLERRLSWTPAGREIEESLWVEPEVVCDRVDVIRPAVIGRGAIIEPGARLFGRTAIGRNAIVRGGARLEDCVLFEGAEVGYEAEVVNSIVCANAQVGPGTRMDQSIIGAGVRLGGHNVLCGTRLWPGVVLGDRAIVVDE
ncbi:MAG: NDP-sugar synthase [Actinobacteria bacterium]|nr:NDP-sugar synthase [Actinomycetota bacterium]